MPKKNAINLNFDISSIDAVIKEFVELQRATNAPTEKIEKILKDLYKLQDAAKNGTPVTVNSLNSITSRLSQFGSQMKDSFSTEYIESLNKKVKELTQNIAENEKEMAKLKKANPQLKGNVTRYSNQKDKLLKDTMGQKLFDDENELKSFARGNVTAEKKITDKMTAQEKTEADLYNKKLALAKQYAAQYDEIEKKLKNAKQQLRDNEKAQSDLVVEAKKFKDTLEDTIQPDVAEALSKAGQHTSDLSNNLRQVTVDSNATGGSLVTLSNSANLSSMSFGKMAKSMTIYKIAVQGVKKLLSSAMQTFKEMDSAITNMAVVTGRSREELWGMTKDFKNLAQQAGSTMTEMADLTTEFVRQGRSMSDAKTLAVETAKAAKIAGISVSDSLTYMTSAINGFNLAAEDASRVSDIFAKVAAVSATDYNQLAIALSKVSAQANQAGMSIEYTTALLAKGIETTQEAPESIGTALKTIIARFRELSNYGSTLEDGMNVNKVESALKAVGIELRNESGEFRDLTEVLNELGPKWDDLNTMQRQAIAQAAAGTRQQSRFLAIMQDWDRTMELVDSAQDSAGASAAQYAKYAEGLTATLTNLKTTWQEFTTKAVNSELVVNTLQTVNNILNGISNMLDGNVLQPMIVGLTAILGIRKTMDMYDKFKIAQAAKMDQYLKAEGYEQELLLDRAKLSTAEFQKQAEIKYNQHIENIKAKKKELESQKAEEETTINNLYKEKETTLEIEKQAKLQAAKAQGASDAAINAITAEYNAKKASLNHEKQLELNKIDAIYQAETNALDDYASKLGSLKQAAMSSVGLGGNKFSLIDSFKNVFGTFTKGFSQARKSGEKFTKSMKAGFKSMDLKGTAKSMGKMAGYMAGIVAALHLIKRISEEWQESVKTTQDYVNDINKIYGEIGSLYNENSTLEKAIEDYTILSEKISKTAEEQDKLKEMEKAFASGDYGEDVTDIESARAQYAKNDREIETKYDEILSKAMMAAAKEGAKVLDDSEFLVSLKEIAKREITIKVTNAQTKKAKEVTEAAMNNYDFDKAYQSLDVSGIKSSVGFGQGFDWQSALTDFGMMAGGGAAFGASVGGPWGALIGGIIGSVAATGTIIWKQTNTYKNNMAKAVAGEMERKIAATTQEVQKFAIKYGETAEESLSNQYANFAKLMESNEFSDEAKALVAQAEKGFSTLTNLGFTPERIKKLQGEVNKITDSTFKAFVDLAANYGEEGSKAFYAVWEDLVDYYKGDARKVSADLYKVINGLESDATIAGGVIAEFDSEKYSAAAVEEAEKEANEALDLYTNLVKGKDADGEKLSKDDMRNLALDMGMTDFDPKDEDALEKLTAKAKERYDLEAAEASNLAQTFKKVSEAALNTISTFGTFNDLSQGLTTLQSTFENIRDFRKELEEGTISLENLNTVATQYSHVFGTPEAQEAIARGDYNAIADLLGSVSTVSDMVKDQREMVNGFIARQNAELEVAISRLDASAPDYEEQVKALRENTQAQINAAELYAKMYYQITGTQQIQRNRKYAERAWQKGIDNGEISAYVSRYNASLDILNDYEKDYKDFKYNEANNLKVVAGDVETTFDKIYDNILDGNWDLYNALSDEDKETFYSYLSTLDEKEQAFYDYTQESLGYYEEYQDKIVESQNEAIEIYKDNLKKETDELKKQIDKRKEYYEKFYDALEQEDETQDYENERQRLLNTISRLSTSRDANSLARLKEAQAELAELEKEQRQSERESRKENTMNLLDEYSDEVDNAYEKAIEDNAKIWEMFSKEGSDTMVEMLRKWARATDGYDKMTEEQQAQWDRDFNKKAVNWGYSSDSTVSNNNDTTPSTSYLSSQGETDSANVTSQSAISPDGGKTVTSTVTNNSTITDSYNNVVNNITQNFPNVRSVNDMENIFKETQKIYGVIPNAKV